MQPRQLLRRTESALLLGGGHPRRWASSKRGRGIQMGFRETPGKGMQVKQQGTGAVQRIPGTTKVEVTNKKGRKFSFSIPVGAITQPPQQRNSPSGSWVGIDTSWSDLGDLEDDMPTEVAACLDKHRSGDEVEMDVEGLKELQHSMVELCRSYALMDTRGMTNTPIYGELNSGPDYEMYDRKTRRRRHWLAIRHRFEDVKELLWPSTLLEEGVEEAGPVLSARDLLEVLVWVEAANTFSVRTRKSYDVAEEAEFGPISLTREVMVLGRCIQQTEPTFFRSLSSMEGADGAQLSVASLSDRFISCAALCRNHGVPFTFMGDAQTKAAHAMVVAIPEVTRVKDAVRVMSTLLQNRSDAPQDRAHNALCFSAATGAITEPDVLHHLLSLTAAPAMTEPKAMENLLENELCVALQFVVEIREHNTAFFEQVAPNVVEKDVLHLLHAFNGFTSAIFSRCRRYLSEKQLTVMSGDEQHVPLIDLQKFAERSHPQAIIHYHIGTQNAQGLRSSSLKPADASSLADLLDRLATLMGPSGGRHRHLGQRLLQKLAAQISSSSHSAIRIEDVLRVLPLMAKELGSSTTAEAARQRFERLFAAIDIAISAEMQQRLITPKHFIQLLQGLAACHFVPACAQQMEMVSARIMMQGLLTMDEVEHVVHAFLRLLGPDKVSTTVLELAARQALGEGDRAAALPLLRTLYYAHYPSLLPLLRECYSAEVMMNGGAATWSPTARVSYGALLTFAAASLPDDDAQGLALCSGARAALHHLPPAVGMVDDDLLVDCVTACAALDLRSHREVEALSAMAERATSLHSLCTPSLAVSVLESMHTLNMGSGGILGGAYRTYLVQALEQFQVADPPLRNDDAMTVVRLLNIDGLSTSLRGTAAALLQREVEHLCKEASSEDARPLTSFEQQALRTADQRSDIADRILRYSSALTEHGYKVEVE